MILVWIIVIMLAGGIAAWSAERVSPKAPRWIALATLAIELGLLLTLWPDKPGILGTLPHGSWIVNFRVAWIPRFGIGFHLALDGLSLLMALLTIVLGMMAVVASWSELQERIGFFHFNLLWTLAGVLGVFMALDLFLFFFCWEAMLVPMYFIIGLWGHEDRRRAAIKFFIFTQASGLIMLAALLALVLFHASADGVLTFDYLQLLGTVFPPAIGFAIMLGFFVAFAVKLPVVPIHTWLPDAHTEAPTGGSVILAGVLLKTGAYGLLRFAVPLFPIASETFAPYAMALGALGILYGAVLAFGQRDFKRLVAYSSISHMGFVLVGIYAWNALALQGAVMQILAHGLGTGALFIIAGMIQERMGTRDMREMGGLWATAPRMGAVALFFAIASLGLPGLGNFIGEFLILTGAFQANVVITVIAALGVVVAVIYSLALMQRAFFGRSAEIRRRRDLVAREAGLLLAAAVLLVWLGLYPTGVLDVASPSLSDLRFAQYVPSLLVDRGQHP